MYDNLNNYRVFYTVATVGNISQAANTLFISQPAISKSISKLEEGLGSKLFYRTSKGVKLTDEGQLLYNYIKKAFDFINQGEDEIKRINELGIGQLKIGASTSLCKHILLDYLHDFIIEYPHIKVTIDCHSTLNTMKLLQEGQIDIGLICETNIPQGFVYNKLTDIHDIFVTNNSYLSNFKLREYDDEKEITNPWLLAGNLTSLFSSEITEHENNKQDKNNQDKNNQVNKKMSINEILEKSNLMLLEKNNITRTHIDSYLNSQNIRPNQILEINNMDLLIDFASIGMGVASVVREFATEYLDSGQIIELKPNEPIKKRTVGFVYSNNNSKPAALEKFIDFCINKKSFK